jgi:hypothetical protein
MAHKTDGSTAVGFDRLTAWATASPSIRKAVLPTTGRYQPRSANFAADPVRSAPLRSPVAEWIRHLMDGSSDTTVICPRCGRQGGAPAMLDHALTDHGLTFFEAATWLELSDPDLFALAIHYLMSKGRRDQQPAAPG